MVRKKVKGSKPRQQEEFRQKITVEGHAWAMMAERFTNIAWLRNIESKDAIDIGRHEHGSSPHLPDRGLKEQRLAEEPPQRKKARIESASPELGGLIPQKLARDRVQISSSRRSYE